jgi:hypothetical protein
MPWWWSAAAGFFAVRGTSQQANSARRRGYHLESAAEKPSAMSFSLDAAISSTKGSSFQVVSNPLIILGTGAVDWSTDSVALSLTIKLSTLSVEISEVRSKDVPAVRRAGGRKCNAQGRLRGGWWW